ncbi:MAG: replicative DNA helicase [Candidatus Methylomirabilales bacterium]
MALSAVATDRIPPQNLEAEIAVLGAILLDNAALLRALEVLLPDHFYKPAHRIVFSACVDLFERNEPVDTVTLANELERRGRLEEVGGRAFIASLVDTVPTAANINYHAKIVREKSLLRSLISSATGILTAAYQEQEGVDEILDESERAIFEVSKDRIRIAFRQVKSILKSTFEYIEGLYARESRVTGVPTGFKEFDEMTGGFQNAELIIIAGRPSMGKTSFGLNIAAHAAIHENVGVGVFSLEMSAQQVVQRLLCAEAGVEAYRLRTGRLSPKEHWAKLTTAAGTLSEAKIYLDDAASMSVLELRAKARRLKAESNVGLIMIDYLQLLSGRGRVENRQQEISEICRSLKALAKELEIPIMALSQLSRAVEAREEKRPQLADLRESGAIEQDADLVAFIYRPGYYKALRNPNEEENLLAQIIVAKQRNGPTGSVDLVFRREFMKFENAEVSREVPGFLAN